MMSQLAFAHHTGKDLRQQHDTSLQTCRWSDGKPNHIFDAKGLTRN